MARSKNQGNRRPGGHIACGIRISYSKQTAISKSCLSRKPVSYSWKRGWGVVSQIPPSLQNTQGNPGSTSPNSMFKIVEAHKLQTPEPFIAGAFPQLVYIPKANVATLQVDGYLGGCHATSGTLKQTYTYFVGIMTMTHARNGFPLAV